MNTQSTTEQHVRAAAPWGNLVGNGDKKNVEATTRFSEEIQKGNLDIIGETFAPDFVDHDPAPDQGEGAEGLRGFWASFRTASPDLEIQVDELVADDGKAAIAYTVSGTHQGDFEGHPPTGKRMSVRGLQLTRIEDGMVMESIASSTSSIRPRFPRLLHATSGC